MINIINGIIVEDFQSQRQENNKIKDLKENSCFVCSIERAKFEARGIDFHTHIYSEHNVIDYYQLFLKIQSLPVEDLTYIEYYVLKNKLQNLTDFLPSKTSKHFI